MNSGLFKNVIFNTKKKLYLFEIELFICMEIDSALNNLHMP